MTTNNSFFSISKLINFVNLISWLFLFGGLISYSFLSYSKTCQVFSNNFQNYEFIVTEYSIARAQKIVANCCESKVITGNEDERYLTNPAIALQLILFLKLVYSAILSMFNTFSIKPTFRIRQYLVNF